MMKEGKAQLRHAELELPAVNPSPGAQGLLQPPTATCQHRPPHFISPPRPPVISQHHRKEAIRVRHRQWGHRKFETSYTHKDFDFILKTKMTHRKREGKRRYHNQVGSQWQ
ncbi:uncharacterized protein LOC144281704 [Canis aureus]